MKRKSTTATFDEDTPITQADIDAGKLILRKRVPARYENMIHLIGFATLIVLMLIITAQDIINPIQLR